MAKPITKKQFSLAELVRTRYAMTPEAGATLEDVLAPEATMHIAAGLRIGDVIEVMPEDQAWHAELKVKDCARTWAKYHVLHHVDLNQSAQEPDAPADPAQEQHVVSWGGPHQKFRVTRKADGAMLKDGFADKKEANAWMVEHEKA